MDADDARNCFSEKLTHGSHLTFEGVRTVRLLLTMDTDKTAMDKKTSRSQ